MAVLALNEMDATSVYSAVRCRKQQNDTYTPVGRDVSRFQQLTSRTDTSLTGFDVIFSNTHHHYSPRSHFLHKNAPTPLHCVHHPSQYIRRIELANNCCTFPRIKTLVTPKHTACHGEKCIREGNLCLQDDFEDIKHR